MIEFGSGPFINGQTYTGSNGIDYEYNDGCFLIPSPQDINTQDGYARQGVSDGTARDAEGNLIPTGSKIIVFYDADDNAINAKDCTDLNDFSILVEAAADGIDDAQNPYQAGDQLLQLPSGKLLCQRKTTDTFARLIVATVASTDDVGNDYDIGDRLLELPSGDLVCQKKTKDTFAGLIRATQAGVDDAGNSYPANAVLLELPNGDIVCQHKTEDTFTTLIFASTSGIDDAGNNFVAGDPMLLLPSGDLVCQAKTQDSDTQDGFLVEGIADGTQLDRLGQTIPSGARIFTFYDGDGQVIHSTDLTDMDTLTQTFSGAKLGIDPATGCQVLPNYALSLNGVPADANGNLSIVIPADVHVENIIISSTYDPTTQSTSYQFQALLSDGTSFPFGPVMDLNTSGSVDALTNPNYFIFSYPNGTTAQVCKNPVKSFVFNGGTPILPNINGQMELDIEIKCETEDGDYVKAEWDPNTNCFTIPFKPQTHYYTYVPWDSAIHTPGSIVGSGAAGDPVQIPLPEMEQDQRISNVRIVNNPVGGENVYSFEYDVIDIDGNVVNTLVANNVPVPTFVNKAGIALTGEIEVLTPSDFVATSDSYKTATKLFGFNAAGECMAYEVPEDPIFQYVAFDAAVHVVGQPLVGSGTAISPYQIPLGAPAPVFTYVDYNEAEHGEFGSAPSDIVGAGTTASPYQIPRPPAQYCCNSQTLSDGTNEIVALFDFITGQPSYFNPNGTPYTGSISGFDYVA